MVSTIFYSHFKMENVLFSISFAAFIGALVIKDNKKKSLKPTNAVCVIDASTTQSVSGYVLMTTVEKGLTKFVCYLNGLNPGLHGFHVHEHGDLREKCKSACSHYNPDGNVHGGPTGRRRHKGDLGNITVTSKGDCYSTIYAEVDLSEIIGRMIVIHEDPDDLGLGLDKESQKTGNSGERIACGVIGRI